MSLATPTLTPESTPRLPGTCEPAVSPAPALGHQHSHVPLTVAVSSWHPTERKHSRKRWFASGQR
jgi:hypothetical protein